MRALRGGKLKSQILNGEEYPPYLKDVDVTAFTLPGGPAPRPDWFAVGNPFFDLLPGMALWTTIWLREHNRIARIVEREHPTWDDERLYQTAKLIVVGRYLKILIEDYVQHLSGYNLKLLMDCRVAQDFIQFQSRAYVEFGLMYQWHELMPEFHLINGTRFDVWSLFYQPHFLTRFGTKELVASFSKQQAGAIGPLNDGNVTINVVAAALKGARSIGMQPYNNYRSAFGLEPYKTFEELTGEKELAAALRVLYKDVNAVEFYVGVMAEKIPDGAFFRLSMPNLIGISNYFLELYTLLIRI